MTIATNRIRYLDKENKVLVQDFSDLSANSPMSNVDTPMTIPAMDAIDDAFRFLQDLQRDIVSLANLLTSENIGSFLIDTIMNGLRLNLPGFPQVAMFIDSLRNLDPQLLAGVINALLLESSNRILDNPHLINTKDKKIQQQIVNLAINDFARKLQNGQVTQQYIQQITYSTAIDDPYAVNKSINKIVNEFKYNTDTNTKFKLPQETRTSKTLIAHISLSMAFHNYYHTTIRVNEVLSKRVEFIDSILNSDTEHSNMLKNLRTELTLQTVEKPPVHYFIEKVSRELSKDILLGLSLHPDINFLSVYKDLQLIRMNYHKQGLTGKLPEMYRETYDEVYRVELLSGIADNLLPEVPTQPDYDQFDANYRNEYINHLQSVLLKHLQAGTAGSEDLRRYILANAQATLLNRLLEARNTVPVLHVPTVDRLLLVLLSLDIYDLEGRYDLVQYQVSLTTPILSFRKMDEEIFYTVLLEMLRLMYRQAYITYPKTPTVGLLEILVDRLNTSRISIVSNHLYARPVIIDDSKIWSDLKLVLETSLLKECYYPPQVNTFDSEIYKLYRRDISRLVFQFEDVEVV